MSDLPPIIDGSTSGKLKGSGSFVVGTLAEFFFTFSDIDGNLFDPSNISISILDPSLNEAESIDSADKIELGVFLVQWDIPDDATVGRYTITVNYDVETSSGTVSRSFSEEFVVSESGQGIVRFRSTVTRAFLESLIKEAQTIPIHHEPARLNRARTIAELTFPRWNQSAGVKVFINNELKESGYTVDYLRGKVEFNNPLSQYDQILVSYNFRWFTDEELDGFLEQGVNMFNVWPPVSVYTINNIPDVYLIVSVHASAVLALRRLLFGLNYQTPIKVYGGIRLAQERHAMWMEQKKNYEDWLEKMLTQKKFGPYPGIRTVSTDPYSLPGGKSRWFRYLMKGGM